MTTTLAVLTTDGRRDTLVRTIESAQRCLRGDIGRRVIFTDGGNPEHVAWLAETFPAFVVIASGERQGYAAAMRAAFRELAVVGDGWDNHVFWLEDDFTFKQRVDLNLMAAVLNANPQLMQLALRRQPWNDEERAAGGIVELHADWYTDVRDHVLRADWLEQTAFWTNNPCMFRRELCARVPYPIGADAEGRFTFDVKAAYPFCCFGYWGSRLSGEWVEHIGLESVRGAF